MKNMKGMKKACSASMTVAMVAGMMNTVLASGVAGTGISPKETTVFNGIFGAILGLVQVIGYAYAGAYSARAAYRWTATTSIYVDKDYRRRGIGSALYRELEQRLRDQGIVNLLAGAAFCETEDEYLTHDSYKFHQRSGYEKVAHLKGIGKKFDRWYDLLWMQKKV